MTLLTRKRHQIMTAQLACRKEVQRYGLSAPVADLAVSPTN